MGVFARAVAVARNATPVGFGVRVFNGLGIARTVAVACNATPVGFGMRLTGADVVALGGMGVSLGEAGNRVAGATASNAVALAWAVAVAAGVADAGAAVGVLVLTGKGVGSVGSDVIETVGAV